MHYTPDAAAAPIMDAFFKEREKHFATQHHIDSFDDLLGTRLRAIVRSMNPITMVREDPNTKTKHTVKVYVGGDEKLRPDHDVHIGDPTPTLPSQARIANQTYGADIFADVHVVYPDDNDETRDFKRVHIGFMPIMIHSKACSLRGLNPHQLRARGECPYDMGGYFVIDGREKVIVTQEERVPNRLYTRRGEKIEYDKLILKAFIRCVSTDARDVFPRTSVFRVMTSGEITATVTHINEGAVPVTTLFRALGIESDRAILKTIFHEDPGEERNKVEIEFMHASIASGHKSGVSSQRGAIDFLIPRTRFKSQLDLKSVLTDDLFPNVGRTFEAKAIALGEVVRHLVRAALGKEPMSELDHYANNRLMCSGAITANLFRDAYLLSIATTLRTLNEEFLTGPWRVANDIHTLVNEANLKNIFQPRIIREALVRALKGSRRGDDNARAPVQELSRVSYLGYISHMRRVNNPVDRNVKIADTHRLRPSHWGVICPVESPDGPNINKMLREGDAVVGMVKVPSTAAKEDVFTDASQRLQSRESDLPTYVDGVHLQNIDQNTAKDTALPKLRACKVRLRQMRSPELGDKLSSRYGQKGVVGMILPAVDMPFCAEDGIVPDIIINPNAFPNRRTVSHILEAVLAREGAVKGARMNADTFGGEDIGAALTQLGLRENGHGNMLMHNRRSGEEAKTRIFVGVNYYGRLKHMVEDKYQSRARGAVDATTRQPTKSKGQSGGLRIGEMEQNALIAHGLASFTREAFMQRSDHHSTKVNATSGTPAEWWAAAREDPEGPDDEATVETPYTFTLMQHELRALGVEAALLTSTDEFYL
eukprot:gene29315-biopygen7658